MFGLNLEFWAEVAGPAFEKPAKHFRWFRSWVHWYMRFGILFVAAGVCGELYSEGQASEPQGRLRDLNRSIVVGVEAEVSRANERASINEKEAARLRKLAEDEANARVRIEQELVWRTVSPKQLAIIRAQLVPSPKASVMIVYFGADPEGVEYAEDLGNALQPGWSVREEGYMGAGALPHGLQIRVSDAKNWRGRTLQNTLEAAGIHAEIVPPDAPVQFGGQLLPDEVRLIVGSKPRPSRPSH